MPDPRSPDGPRPRRPRPEPEALQIAVLYEDDWLLAIDKPPGIVVHPTYRNWTGTILNGLLWRYRDRAAIEPRIATRLDKDTSGVVVVALSADVHARVQRDMAAGMVRKEYVAIVHGHPTPRYGTIALPLARSQDDRRRVVVNPEGQPCRTDYDVLAALRGRSAVRCVPLTGRTHQIRVHLAACGWPIAGDRVYGPAEPADDMPRQALHAWRVSMPHPVSRERIVVEAGVPEDMARLSALGFGLSALIGDQRPETKD